MDVLGQILLDLVQMGPHLPLRLGGIPGQDGVHNIAVGHDRVLHVLLHLEGLAAEGLHSLAHMAVDLDHQCVPAALHDGAVELLVQAADHSRVPLLNGA